MYVCITHMFVCVYTYIPGLSAVTVDKYMPSGLIQESHFPSTHLTHVKSILT